jgi:hypothetical protein
MRRAQAAMSEGHLIFLTVLRVGPHQNWYLLPFFSYRFEKSSECLIIRRHSIWDEGWLDRARVQLDDGLTGGEFLFDLLRSSRALADLSQGLSQRPDRRTAAIID